MKNKYPIGTIFLREFNNNYGIVVKITKGHDKLTPVYSIVWSQFNPKGIVYDYAEEELGRWYIKV